MEANMVRILLLIALFFLLSSDYSSVVKQLVPTFEAGEEETESDSVDLVSRIKVDSHQQQQQPTEEQSKRGSATTGTAKVFDETEDAVLVARKKILNAVKNSCLPKLICELNAAPNKENLSQSEVSLLNLLRDTSIMSTAEITSKYHFAAHMGQLISGIEGTGCHNFYPDCPLPGFRVSQLLKNIRFK